MWDMFGPLLEQSEKAASRGVFKSLSNTSETRLLDFIAAAKSHFQRKEEKCPRDSESKLHRHQIPAHSYVLTTLQVAVAATHRHTLPTAV